MIKSLNGYYQNLQPLDIAEVQQRVTEMNVCLDLFESVVDERPANGTVKLTYEELYFAELSRQ